MTLVHDVARIRLDNAMRLFDEFVQATIKAPDAATLRGLERRFAERLQIQPSYWSQIKGRSRQIGERLARQFEQLCRKPVGWMDLPHAGGAAGGAASLAPGAGSAVQPAWVASSAPPAEPAASPSQPQDDDERFIVGLVLTYYRRHPQRARNRLLDLLGEVLTPPAAEPATAARTAPPPPLQSPPAPRSGQRAAATPRGRAAAPAAAPPPPADDLSLWLRTQAGIAPLKRKP